jgi:cytochrome c biogenesis protein CcmG/thiol:disulfide interchange protein DsbE
MNRFSATGTTHRQHGSVLAVVLLVLGILLNTGAHSEQESGFEVTAPKQRLAAPAFRLPDLAAGRVSLEDFRGKVVLAHFWATFCVPCLHEMPGLETLWQEYRERGLVIVGIAADRGSVEVVRDFSRKTGITFPLLHDADGLVRNRYEVMALPMSYIIGRDGKISGRAIGSQDWNSAAGRRVIEAMLQSDSAL